MKWKNEKPENIKVGNVIANIGTVESVGRGTNGEYQLVMVASGAGDVQTVLTYLKTHRPVVGKKG